MKEAFRPAAFPFFTREMENLVFSHTFPSVSTDARMHIKDDVVTIGVQLPGVASAQVSVAVENRRVTVSAPRRTFGDASGIHTKSTQSIFRLPFTAFPEDVRAVYANNLLTLTITKNTARSFNVPIESV